MLIFNFSYNPIADKLFSETNNYNIMTRIYNTHHLLCLKALHELSH